MKPLKFILIQHAQGSAGKFLSTLLMCSKSVAHYDPVVEQNKNQTSLLEYNRRHFTKDIAHWLKFEPKPNEAWNLHFVSPLYERGQNLSCDEFEELASQHGSDHYHRCVRNSLWICQTWHKIEIPKYFQCCPKIAVIIDDKSIKWFHRALWHKHYGLTNGFIHRKNHDPDFNTGIMKRYYDQYQNTIFEDRSVRTFLREEIVKNSQKKLFSDRENFSQQDHLRIELSSILDATQIVNTAQIMYDYIGLGPVDSNLIWALHDQWKTCHDFKYN